MEKSLPRFIRWHKSMGHSAKTISYYTTTLEAFTTFLKQHSYPTAVDELHVDFVREWVEQQQDKELSDATIATRITALKAFSKWLVSEEWLPKDPFTRLKVPKVADKPKDILTPQAVDKLLITCGNHTVNGLRDRAIILLLYSTGVRANELTSLCITDIDYARSLIHIRKGKGGKYRLVPLGVKVDRAIERYLAKRIEGEQHPHLFLTDEGSPFNYVALRQMLRRRSEKAQVHAHPHLFRHSFAVQYLRNGGKLETLRNVSSG
jgi:site-specific recombinase XerD